MKLCSLYPFRCGENVLFQNDRICLSVLSLHKSDIYVPPADVSACAALLAGSADISDKPYSCSFSGLTLPKVTDCTHSTIVCTGSAAYVLLLKAGCSSGYRLELEETKLGAWWEPAQTGSDSLLFFRFYPSSGYALVKDGEQAYLARQNDTILVKSDTRLCVAPGHKCRLFRVMLND